MARAYSPHDLRTQLVSSQVARTRQRAGRANCMLLFLVLALGSLHLFYFTRYDSPLPLGPFLQQMHVPFPPIKRIILQNCSQLDPLLVPAAASTCNCPGCLPPPEPDKSSLSNEEGFIYVYDIGKEWNTDLMNATIRWWSKQYEPEREIFDMLSSEDFSRTYDPEKAILFYVPFFAARYFLLNHEKDTPEAMKGTLLKTSQKWSQVLAKIKEEFPYFARHNGRDHFSALTMDHGRCTALTYCNPTEYGEMFFLQLNADKMVRSNHVSTSRGIQALTFNYNASVATDIPDIPCYMADRDIPIPPISTSHKITRPQETDRPIVALFRFSPGQHHGVPIPHFNHFIRKELLEMYTDKHHEGWSVEVKSEWNTRKDWQEAKFCVCPPGHSQWTSRPAKSILAGCIPINFYRDHDNPWEDDLDYERFTLNVDADRLHTLKEAIDRVLDTPGKLAEMQRELEAAQEAYVWGPHIPNGARAHAMKSLKRRAEKLHRLQNAPSR